MKNSHSSLAVWDEAVDNVEKSQKTKYSITKNMVQRRLRPEPEIIEHILEDLEEKIRYYFNLFRLEKEKRTTAEKNSYYLQEELAKLYETFEKSKIYTMKLEDKLKKIKGNQSSLIDTVRRIDLLYIQLDTLVQSFAGVCTQTAADVVDGDAHLKKKQQTIQMLLDYIYPCRTLDPRINALYGLLYYQTIGLINGKYTGPPVPPIPPVVPTETNGWLPPSPLLFQKDNFNEKEKPVDGTDISKTNSAYSHSDGTTRSVLSSRDNKDYGDGYGKQELLGFDIKIGTVELRFDLENPKIVCVARYDHETAYAAIQNSKRITKPQIPYEIIDGNHFKFKINTTININNLPPKKPGVVPKFKIDVHDIKEKVLIGTAKCSFINEKTLTPNAPWDIYSRTGKEQPDVLGKIYVTVFPYPSKAKLPAESFKELKMGSGVHVNSSSGSHNLNSSQMESVNDDTYNQLNKYNSSSSVKYMIKKSSGVSGKGSAGKIGNSSLKPTGHKMVSFKDQADTNAKEPKFAPQGFQLTKVKPGEVKPKPKMTVTFKPYSSKTSNVSGTGKNSKTEKSGNMDAKDSTSGAADLPQTDKTQNVAIKTKISSAPVKSVTEKIDPFAGSTKTFDILKKPASASDMKLKGSNVSNVKMLINKMSKLSSNLNKQDEPLGALKARAKNSDPIVKLNSSVEEKLDEQNNVKNPMKVKLPYFTKKDAALKALTTNGKMNESMSKGTNATVKSTTNGKSNTIDPEVSNSHIMKSSLNASKEKSNSDSTMEKKLPVEESGEKALTTVKMFSKKMNMPLLKPTSLPQELNKSGTSQTVLKKSGDLKENDLRSKSQSSTKTDLSNKSLSMPNPNAEPPTKNEDTNNKEQAHPDTKLNGSLTETTKKTLFQKKISPKINSPGLKNSIDLKNSKDSKDLKISKNSKDSKDFKDFNKLAQKGDNSTEKSIEKPIVALKKNLLKLPSSIGMKRESSILGKHSTVKKTSLLNQTNLKDIKKETITSKTLSDSPKTKLSASENPKHKIILNTGQKNKSPPVSNVQIDRIDSDDPKLKKILASAQKKSVFINKEKIKQKFVFKPKEQKRVIKKFTPKFQAKPA